MRNFWSDTLFNSKISKLKISNIKYVLIIQNYLHNNSLNGWLLLVAALVMWMNNYIFSSEEKMKISSCRTAGWDPGVGKLFSKISPLKSGLSCEMVLIYDWIMPGLQWKCSPRWLELVRMLAGERRGVWSSPVSTLSWPRCCQLFLGSQPDNLSLSLSLSLPAHHVNTVRVRQTRWELSTTQHQGDCKGKTFLPRLKHKHRAAWQVRLDFYGSEMVTARTRVGWVSLSQIEII